MSGADAASGIGSARRRCNSMEKEEFESLERAIAANAALLSPLSSSAVCSLGSSSFVSSIPPSLPSSPVSSSCPESPCSSPMLPSPLLSPFVQDGSLLLPPPSPSLHNTAALDTPLFRARRLELPQGAADPRSVSGTGVSRTTGRDTSLLSQCAASSSFSGGFGGSVGGKGGTSRILRRSAPPVRGSPSAHDHMFKLSAVSGGDAIPGKLAVFKKRGLWTLVLIAFLLLILAFGHLYCSLLVFGVITLIYRENISLYRKKEKDKRLPLFFVLRWYWFSVTIFWLGIPWILPKLLHISTYSPYLYTIQAYHSLVTYSAALLGFVLFILSLRRYTLRYQFSQLGFMLLTLIIVVAQSVIQIANIYRGLIWFILPITLVIVNDIFSYIFGILFGRTKLIKLSPNKTVEGFAGASVMTLLWAVLVSSFMQEYPAFTCPQSQLELQPSAWWSLECPRSPLFHSYTTLKLPHFFSSLFGLPTLSCTPMQLHAIVLGVFAAFVAPFGGFFASGFKRAIRIKDFGDSIPGHGGFTDRIDCQILMGMFTYVYLKTLLKASHSAMLPSTIDEFMHTIQLLTIEEQLDLFSMLKTHIGATLASRPERTQHSEKLAEIILT